MPTAELRIKFSSPAEMNAFIENLNPRIIIEYDDYREVQNFKQKLGSLIDEKVKPQPQNTSAEITTTHTPAAEYKLSRKVPALKDKVCANQECSKIFMPHHSRVMLCPECKKAEESKKVKKHKTPPG